MRASAVRASVASGERVSSQKELEGLRCCPLDPAALRRQTRLIASRVVG
jgi:hypothetical protein